MSPLVPSRWRIRVEPLARAGGARRERALDPPPAPAAKRIAAAFGFGARTAWPTFPFRDEASDGRGLETYAAAVSPRRPRLGLKLDRIA